MIDLQEIGYWDVNGNFSIQNFSTEIWVCVCKLCG